MVEIEKKIWPKYFEDILNGEKRFELRLNDFEINKGDILILKEWNPEKKEYTGRVLKKEATYILKTKDINLWSKEEIEKYGLQIISLN